MSNPLISVHDSETDETVTREMNDAEFKVYEADQAASAAAKSAATKAATDRAALLTRLGITDAEAKLL